MRETEVHPTAIVDPAAAIGPGVVIGPYCLVGPNVRLGDGATLKSHVVVDGLTVIGPGTTVYPFATIGLQPQDLKYAGEPSRLEIGRDNVIREHVTMHTGTEGGGMVTRIGDGGLFMVGVHVAHDCQIGDRVILANNAALAGHVTIGDEAILGGLAAVHQFVRIGARAIVGAMTAVDRDVIPYGSVKGHRGTLSGLNLVGMRRRGIARADIEVATDAFDMLFRGPGALRERVAALEASGPDDPRVLEILSFLRSDPSRPVCQPPVSGTP